MTSMILLVATERRTACGVRFSEGLKILSPALNARIRVGIIKTLQHITPTAPNSDSITGVPIRPPLLTR